MARPFLDTNILLYLLSADATKANLAEDIVAQGGTISVQVLNEFAAVAGRKLRLDVAEIREVLGPIRTLCRVTPLSTDTHDRALHLVERHRFAFYDALIVGAALEACCDTLYSEDLQHGQIVDGVLTIRNPFKI
ncbi:MAG: PIN domain-containing protein [Ectothiorhodospiraceae bacterium]|nr:PIN domain-containing protein [Ectothiorhodospiraceae bacterium]